MAFHLVIAKGSGEGQQFIVVQPETTIGRTPENDIVLAEVGVSREHARIFEQGGRYFLEDLGSANGTLLNGAPIAGQRELTTGDSVAVGPVVLAFSAIAADDVRAGAARGAQQTAVARKPLRPFGDPAQVIERTRTEETQVVFDDAPASPPVAAAPAPALTAALGKLGAPPLAAPGPSLLGPLAADGLPGPGFSPLASGPLAAKGLAAPGNSPFASGPTLGKGIPGLAAAPPPLEAVGAAGLAGPIAGSGRFSALLASATQTQLPATPIEQHTEAAPEPARPLERAGEIAQQETRIARPGPLLTDLPRALVRAAEIEQQETRLKVAAYPGGDEITNVPVSAPDTSPRPMVTALPTTLLRADDEGTISEVAPRPVSSAAERARARRQASQTLGGQLGYLWARASPAAKAIAAAVAVVVLGTTGTALWVIFGQGDGPKLGAEGSRLGPEPLEQSFGLGEGVQFRRPDMKIFHFEFSVPTQAVAVLHYQASEISADEVAIIVNGIEQGMVPADTHIADRELEQVLDPKDLKRNARNQLTFDNLRNPPGRESWRIANPRIEVIPVPDLPVPDLLARANEFARRGKDFYDLRDVGSDNLFKAWKSYRQAWITLLALPAQTRPELFAFAADQMAALGRQLDQQCRTLMLDAKRNMQLKNPDKAKETLDDVARYFPTTEHRCHNLALQAMNEYEL